jgi:ferredoxin
MPEKKSVSVDIFGLLSDAGGKESKVTEKSAPNKTQRQELLETTKVKDLYPEGTITINKYTCVGVQCKLCIKACPTNALYWTNNGIGVTEDLCVHCEACVLCCMVDNCIRITRKREDGKQEQFSNVREVQVLNNKINSEKRFQRIRDLWPSEEDYSKRFKAKK